MGEYKAKQEAWVRFAIFAMGRAWVRFAISCTGWLEQRSDAAYRPYYSLNREQRPDVRKIYSAGIIGEKNCKAGVTVHVAPTKNGSPKRAVVLC